MPDFVAALIASLALCLGLIALNALTRWTMPLQPFPIDENGFLQIGGAIGIARLAWRRMVASRADFDGSLRFPTRPSPDGWPDSGTRSEASR